MGFHRIGYAVARIATCALLLLCSGCVPPEFFYELRADEVYAVGREGVEEAYAGYESGDKHRFLTGIGKYFAAREWLKASRDYHLDRGEDIAAEIFDEEYDDLGGPGYFWPSIDDRAAELGVSSEEIEHATRVAYRDLGPVYRPLAASGALGDTAADHATDAAREGMTAGIGPRFTPPGTYAVPAAPAAFGPALEYVPPR